MKKLSLLLAFSLLLTVAFIFTSCDQATVDSARSELMDTCVDLLGPYFREATESTAESTTDSSTAPSDILY